MNENATVLIGSLQDFYLGRSVNAAFLSDIRVLAGISDTNIEKIANHFSEIKSYQDEDDVFSYVHSVLNDEEVSSSLSRLLVVFACGSKGFVDWISSLRKSRSINDSLTEDEWSASLRKHALIQGPFPCIAGYQKYEKLQTITGNILSEIDTICDIRPVFDEDRKTIELFFPLITFKFSYRDQQEHEHQLELVVTEEMLELLKEKLDATVKKREILWSMFFPTLDEEKKLTESKTDEHAIKG